MRIALDENLPRPLAGFFHPTHQVTTVQDLGLAGIANGALLALLEGNYDVFVTADKNLRYQQNLAGRSLAIVELPTNRLPMLETMKSEIVAAVTSASPGTYRLVAVATPP
jgi:predicted nuclease of predicted toxin-antitoxin system